MEIETPFHFPSNTKNLSPSQEKKKLTEEILTWVKTEDSVQIYQRLVESIRSDIGEKTQKHSPPHSHKSEELLSFLKSIQMESLAPILIGSLGADSLDSLRFLKESDLSNFFISTLS